MNRLSRMGVLFIALGLMVTSQAQAKKPDWLSGKSKKYPSSSYMIGVGIASSADEARNAALAEIAKMFSVTVAQTARDTQFEALEIENKKSKASSRQESVVETAATTSESLEGTEIAELWADKKSKKVYALALLDRNKAAQRISHQMLTHEERIADLRHTLDGTISPIGRIPLYSKILSELSQLHILSQRRAVIDARRPPSSELASVQAQMQGERETNIRSVVFVLMPSIATRQDTELLESFATPITSYGFSVLPDGKPVPAGMTPCYLSYTATYAPVNRANPQTKYYQWNLAFTIRTAAPDNTVLGAMEPHGQVSDLSDDQAKLKAVRSAQAAIKKEIPRLIDQLFFSTAEHE